MKANSTVSPGRHPAVPPPRSPCPLARALDVLGDRWTLLVVRDLLLGCSRFRDFSASPERIPTNILSDRLERLLRQRVIKHIPAADRTKRQAYQLTKKGEALRPLLAAMRDWGLAWYKETRVLLQADANQQAGSLHPIKRVPTKF